MIIETFDDVFGPKLTQEIHTQMSGMSWKYGWVSDRTTANTQKYWHVHIANDYDSATDIIKEMWDHLTTKVLKKFDVQHFYRCYANAHTYGCHGQTHCDDGDFTMIYYPNLDWKPEWYGGTQVWNDEQTEIIHTSNYKPGRLFVFDAHLPHNQQEVSRLCQELRYVIVFKTHAQTKRLDHYAQNVQAS